MAHRLFALSRIVPAARAWLACSVVATFGTAGLLVPVASEAQCAS